MKLILTRDLYRDDGVFGDLVSEKGGLSLLTLEHSYGLLTKVPKGDYVCKRTIWYKYGVETFEVTGVPNATRILFHTGNTEQDSDGCILLGLARVESERGILRVVNSKAAHGQFMLYLKGVKSFDLTIL